MTTPAAARLYETQPLNAVSGRPVAIFNPHDKPISDLPTIYGFNNGGPPGFMSAVLLAEDGAGLGGHCCSSESYMPHDLGILEGSRSDRHERFQKHYPHGYRMEFVPGDSVKDHAGLMTAYALNQKNTQTPYEQVMGRETA